MKIPRRKFRLFYVDFPWFYNDRKKHRKDNPAKETRFGMGAQGNYSAGCMTDQEILELSPLMEATSEDDAYMFMWATAPRLPFAIEVGEYFGFTYITIAFVWVKTTQQDKVFYGTGAYTGSNVELLLLFRKNPKKRSCWHDNGGGAFKPGQVIAAPHPVDGNGKKIHSRKPAIFREVLEQWLGPVDRVEMFATESAPGWESWGHALSGYDIKFEMLEHIGYEDPRLVNYVYNLYMRRLDENPKRDRGRSA